MENLVGHRRPRITREEALAIREDYKAGMTWQKLCDKHNVGRRVLSYILKGTHVTLREVG